MDRKESSTLDIPTTSSKKIENNKKMGRNSINLLAKLFSSLLLSSLVFWSCQEPSASDQIETIGNFIKVYPNQYNEEQQPIVDAYLAENKAINERGPIDVNALVNGQLPEDTPGVLPSLIVKEDMVRYVNGKYDPDNKLLNDAAYARMIGLQDIMAYPTFAANDDLFMKPFPGSARDGMLVSDLNHNITFYHPIFPGDTLYYVLNSRKVLDNTPEEGSGFRSIVIQSEGSIYNQHGEKVNDAVFRVTENVTLHKDGYEPPPMPQPGPPPGWIAPAWDSRPSHQYTDEDWEKIKNWWKNEERRGEVALYYEDVNIGDMPALTVEGPIMESANPTQPFGTGTGGSKTLRKEILDPEISTTLVRSKHGIYLTAERSGYVPEVPAFESLAGAGGPPPPAPGEEEQTEDLHKGTEDVRAILVNFLGRDLAIRHLHNWMGEKGWLQEIRWGIMEPTSLKDMGYDVPTSPWSNTFLDKVPSMKDKYVNAHGLSRDLAIVKSYVYDKHQDEEGHFVELAWWIETIDGYIFEAGGATIKLPSKEG